MALPNGGRKASQSDRLVHGAAYRASTVSRRRRITAHAEAFGLAALTDLFASHDETSGLYQFVILAKNDRDTI